METADDIWNRLKNLENDLMATRGSGGIYNGKASIKTLQRCVDDATECLEKYPAHDSGDVSPPFAMLAHRRSMAGLPSDPPSEMKCLAWNMAKIAMATLAEAHEADQNETSSIELYESLVDHCRKARMEIWEGESELHSMMSNLALCYKRFGRYEEAVDWYTKADQMCQSEDPDSAVHQNIKRNISVMMTTKAGAATLQSDGSTRKAWKRCWGCNIKAENDGIKVKMMQCQLCLDKKLATPAYYCSKKCQAGDWARHKVFHKSMKARAKASIMLKDEDLASLSARGAGDKVDEDTSYEGIMKSAGVCMIRNDLEGSRRLFRKAIKLDPDNPLAHHNLATVYSNSGHYVGAVNEFVQCVFLIESNGLMYEPYMELWGRSVVSTHAIYRDHGAALVSVSKPRFLLDDERMQMCAKQASELVPSYNECFAMLALLAERRGSFGESNKLYEKAARLSEAKANRDKFQRAANRVGNMM